MQSVVSDVLSVHRASERFDSLPDRSAACTDRKPALVNTATKAICRGGKLVNAGIGFCVTFIPRKAKLRLMGVKDFARIQIHFYSRRVKNTLSLSFNSATSRLAAGSLCGRV
jgi:hypothetical protein